MKRLNNVQGNLLSVNKLFWLWQDDAYEKWLQKMSYDGWHLAGVDYYPGIRFHFVRGESKDYVYKLDYKTTSDKDLGDYLDIFKNAGWEYICSDIAWKYFRKEAVSGVEDDIYSDNTSKIQKYRSLIKLIALTGALELVCFINITITYLLQLSPRSFTSFFGVLYMILAGLTLAFVPITLYGIYKLKKRIGQLKNPVV